MDVAYLGEPRKFLCVSFLIYPIILAFNLVGLHASILTLESLSQCVDDLLRLPLTHQALSNEQFQELADEVLD